jgi:hypothetical protein
MSYQMTTSEAVADVYLLSTGKTDALELTSSKGARILALLNHFSKEWAKGDWRSMRSSFSVGTVTATDTFTLPATMHHASQQEGDFVRITTTASEYDFTIVPIERLYNDGVKLNASAMTQCAISGSSLVFDGAFASGSGPFGGTITIPGYAKPATLTTGTDVIQVDDPQWLTNRAAAQNVFTDRTRVQLYDTLKAEADRLWFEMKQANNSQDEDMYAEPLSSAFGDTW